MVMQVDTKENAVTYMGNLKKGDRVKVTIEAEVSFGSSYGVDLKVGGGIVAIREACYPGVEMEKLEPPVTVFKAGQVVRSKSIPEYTYAIHKNGYVDLYNGVDRPRAGTSGFTSQHYDLVTID